MSQGLASLFVDNFCPQSSIAGSGRVQDSQKSATDALAAKSRDPVHICLVEDNPGDVYLIEKALRFHQISYELICYADGDQALCGLLGNDHVIPDLVLLDLKLPRRDGFEVLREIRGQPRLAGVRVGIITSSEAQTDRHRVELQGIDCYIQKPANLEEFLDRVGQAVKETLAR